KVLIGECENVYYLSPENQELRGLAFDDISPERPRLFVLDAAGKIFVYRPTGDFQKDRQKLVLLETYELPKNPQGEPLAGLRGLAFAVESGHDVFYFLNWVNSSEVISEMWRINVGTGSVTKIDLSQYGFRIGDRELFDITYENGHVFICFDASGYPSRNLRVSRGIIQLRWSQANRGKLEFVRHLPDSGYRPSLGVASMTWEGSRYLWATVGGEYIYCASLPTGRGLFYFKRPTSSRIQEKAIGLAFGEGALWVPELKEGADCLYQVNVTKNPDDFYEGPHILRHLIMTITTEPEKEHPDPGNVYHYYSRPYSYEQLHNQGIWPETERIVDLTGASNARIKKFTYDPAGDTRSRQYMALVEYPSAPAKTYSSRYEIDIWTNDYWKFVYPHRVNQDTSALKGTDYLADDPVLFNLKDKDTYRCFFDRVKKYIKRKYGVPADMDHPYWAARNVLEYIQDHYYYPSRAKGRPATVDYDRQHYDANPGNLKIDLSRKTYDKTQIIACSGTSVMFVGAMRFLGIPARWLGTGTEHLPSTWDTNNNGLLDEGEIATCSNGHRYVQVWLGSHYGWICFDATPSRPEFNDYDPAPPIRSQWRYMNRAARGHLKDKRIVFNVGSAFFKPLYRDFEYDETLAVDNNCGGDQRYNLQGRFDKPELWKLARHKIMVKNVCFVEEIKVEGRGREASISWKLKGYWDRDPQARISIFLQKLETDNGKAKDIAVLARGISPQKRIIRVDLSPYSGKKLRIIIRKDGDPETGGQSEIFSLDQ
ncbi:transglutaminase family protein, partial [Candidatus Aminicenantes bacterium AC-334-K16]|nr:transglutaminase family protein [Candidatus Aminicenantes bacterium AC-334-K16]